MAIISLKRINEHNASQIVSLNPGENTYVFPNINTLAESVFKYVNKNILRAIYLNKEPIGLLMSAVLPPKNGLPEHRMILRMMIDVQYQGKGYGTVALKKYITLCRRLDPQHKDIYVSYHTENKGAIRFYLNNGFKILEGDGSVAKNSSRTS